MEDRTSNSLEQGDALAAKGATGKRVTLASLKDKIASVEYWRPASSPTTTVCAATTATGYTVVGKSGCADPANFDEEKGKTFAFEDCIRQLWPLEGYRLSAELAKYDSANGLI